MVSIFTGMDRVWEDNIKMNLKDMGVRLLARYIARWRTVVDTVMNCRPSYR